MKRPLVLILMAVLTTLSACGGGGGNGNGGGGGGLTYSVSGFVSSALTGAAVQGATLTLSGAGSMSTTTDGSGNYSFTALANGNYTVTAVLDDAVISPDSLSITINGANVANRNFRAARGSVVGSGIGFLPASFVSSEQLRVSLQLADGHIVYTDSSDTPLKKQALDGSPAIALANRFESAENVVLHNGDTFWIDAGDLYRMLPDGTISRLADGERGAGADASTDIVVDATHAYWVDQAIQQACSPACNWVIEKVALAGGNVVELVSADRRINSLAGNAGSLFWQEESIDPWTVGCDCGSKILSIPKAGGSAVLLVDGSLNGNLPAVPPGYTPASWQPTGGIAVSAGNLVFAVARGSGYDLKTVPPTGGAVNHLASVTSTSAYSRDAVLDLSLAGADLVWIDTGTADLKSRPLAGGPVTSLVSGLLNPGGLATNSTTAYWTEGGAYRGCCLAMGEGRVRSIPLAGGGASTVAASLDGPLAISAGSTSLAWTEAWRIAGMPAAGGSVTTRVSGITGNMARIAISQSVVYILDGLLIKSVPLAGGTVTKLAPADSGAIGDLSVRGGDLVADNDSVYWTMLGVVGAPQVRKVATSGGATTLLASEGNTANPQDCYWRIAVDQQNVYWSEGSMLHGVGCAVRKVPIGGGAVTTLLDEAFMADFAVDGVHVYFSEFAGNSIRRVPVDGGSNSLVADQATAWVLANNAANLYWLDLQQASIGGMSKTAGPSDWLVLPLDIAMDPFLAIEALRATESGVYFSESQSGSIYQVF